MTGSAANLFPLDYDFRLNSKGFKDIEFKKEKEPGVYRMLGIGDSFTFGIVPYQDNLSDSSGRPAQYTRAAGPRYEVINILHPGRESGRLSRAAGARGTRAGSGIALVSVFLGNDLIETGQPRTVTSYVASLARFLWKVPEFLAAGHINPGATYEEDLPTFSHERFLDIEAARAPIYVVTNPDTEKMDPECREIHG